MTRALGKAALAAMGVLLTGTAATAASDYEVYQKLWDKYAAPLSGKPRVACVCMDGAHDYALGALRKLFDDEAACYVPSFTPDGVATIHTICAGPFVVLGK